MDPTLLAPKVSGSLPLSTSPVDKKPPKGFTLGRIMRSRHGSLDEGVTPSDSSDQLALATAASHSRRALSLSSFLRQDKDYKRQRKRLYDLQTKRAPIPYASTLPRRKASKETVTRGTIDPKVKKEISTLYDHSRRRSVNGPMDKINTILKFKKMKKRSFLEYLSLVKNAIRDKNQNLALYYASKLTEKGLKKKDQEGVNRVFLMALTTGMSQLVLHLLEKGFPRDVNAPALEIVLEGGESSENTIACPSYFILAVSYGLEDVVSSMSRKGALMTHSWNDLSPLHIASCLFGKGSPGMVNLLLEYGADPLQGIAYHQFIRMKGFPQCTPQAQPKKSTRQVGSDSRRLPEELRESVRNSLVYPLDIGVACRNRDVVAILLSRMNKEGLSRNKFALVVQQDLETLAALLDAGVNPTQTNQRGSNLLHLAARRGNCEIIRLAAYFKIPLDSRGERGWTALHEAVSTHRVSATRLLLSLGADPSLQTNDGDDVKALALKCGVPEKDFPLYFDLQQHKNRDAGELNVPLIIRQYRAYMPLVKKESSTLFGRKFSAPDMRRAITSIDLGPPRPGTPILGDIIPPVSGPATVPTQPLVIVGSPPTRFMVRRKSGLGEPVVDGENLPKTLDDVIFQSAIMKRMETE